MNVVLLLFAVMLGTGRSVFSKRMISGKNGKKSFYFNQFLLFLSGLVSIFACNIKAFSTVTAKTFFYGAIFGIVTIIAQWCYTVALSMGPTSICAMVYSFGFIFPTVSGAIFWNETGLAEVDHTKCLTCGYCSPVCPVRAVIMY